MQTRRINASEALVPTTGYSQALEIKGHDRILFISGQTPTTPDGKAYGEVTGHYAAERGTLPVPYFTPLKGMPGKWTLTARELMTGKIAVSAINLN